MCFMFESQPNAELSLLSNLLIYLFKLNPVADKWMKDSSEVKWREKTTIDLCLLVEENRKLGSGGRACRLYYVIVAPSRCVLLFFFL